MSGIAFAVTAGVGFGLFQAVNRRANQGIDAYRSTFGLLVIGTIALAIVASITQDVSELWSAPITSLLFFAGAGIVHFYFGWTFLTLSQQQVGAARTGAAAAATPLVASLLAGIVLGEGATLATAAGVVLVVIGVAVLSMRGMQLTADAKRIIPWFGLGAALSWGTSPLFIRWGLEGLDSPLLGVTVGMAAAALSYGVSLTVTGRWGGDGIIPRSNLAWLMLAGLLVAVAIASQWASYDLIAIAIATTLMQLSAPVVIIAAPFIVGREMEPITPPLVIGAGLVMAGSILVMLT